MGAGPAIHGRRLPSAGTENNPDQATAGQLEIQEGQPLPGTRQRVLEALELSAEWPHREQVSECISKLSPDSVCRRDARPRDPQHGPGTTEDSRQATQPGRGPSEFQPLPGVLDKPNPQTRAETPPHLPAHRRSHSLRSLGDLGLPQLLLSTLPLTGRGDPGDSTDFVAEDKESPVAPPSPTTPLRQKKLSLVLADRSHAGKSGSGAYIPSVRKSRAWGMCSAKVSGPRRPRSLRPHRRPAVRQDAASHGLPCTAEPCSQKTVPTACLQPLVLCDRKINQ